MSTATINVRIPQISSLETAIRLYYDKLELSNKDIMALFGKMSSSTMAKLKRAANALIQERDTPIWNAQRVNTEVAYEAWGLDIKKLEYRYNKLKAMNFIEKSEEK